jgi:hypothetical protein
VTSLASLTQLTHLNLANTALSALPPIVVQNWRMMSVLNVAQNALTDHTFESIVGKEGVSSKV